MASARKSYSRSKQAHARVPQGERQDYACIMSDVLDGTITASRLIEVRNPQGRIIRFDYDDPLGNLPQSERSGK
jgi:hypothetical protein